MLKIITLIIFINLLLITNSIGSEISGEEKEVPKTTLCKVCHQQCPMTKNSLYICEEMEKVYSEMQEMSNNICHNTNKTWQECGKNYLAESTDQCSVELKPQYFCDAIYCSTDKPGFFTNFFTGVTELTTLDVIQKTKENLYSLNKEFTEEYVRQIATLLHAVNHNHKIHVEIHHKAEVKWLVFNRILLAKEAYEDLLKKKEPFNHLHHSIDHYMECLQISNVYNQLARIKKEHIDILWKTAEFDDFLGVRKFEYDTWLQQKDNPSVKFLSLLVDIFAPITNRIIPPKENFDEYFGNAYQEKSLQYAESLLN